MLHAILKLLRARKVDQAEGRAPAPEPAPAPAPRKAAGKRRKYSGSKRRRPMPKGAMRGDINGNLIEQARQAGGAKR